MISLISKYHLHKNGASQLDLLLPQQRTQGPRQGGKELRHILPLEAGQHTTAGEAHTALLARCECRRGLFRGLPAMQLHQFTLI